MLSELLNSLWKGGHGKWRQDFRVVKLLELQPIWAYDEALAAIQAETRIAERFFDLSAQQRQEIIEITAALIMFGDLYAPISRCYLRDERI